MHIPSVAATVVLLCLAVAPPAKAANGSRLEHEVLNGTVLTGKCGPAFVQATNVDVDNPHDTKRLIDSQGAIRMTSGGKTLNVANGDDSALYLQDQNKVQCVATPKGPKLVIARYCFARLCAEVDYLVIDPVLTRVISKQDENGECDAVCAKRALGTALPSSLSEIL